MAESQFPEPSPDPVAAQYERWTYPPPHDDLASLPLTGPHSNFKDFRALHLAYWPTETYREDRDILVAGCGTMAAACYAYLYPKARVTGIDLSAASLAHGEFLKGKHQLANLTLHQCAIEEVATLGAEFDFIACHGVLHHLSSPEAGLRALRQVLRRDGVIAIMVYAKYGRVGVYMLQDFFRLLGLGQEPADVEVVRQTLSVVAPTHPVQQYLRMATDLYADSGLVDTFLHPRDKAYSVRDCLDLLGAAGMVFQGWDESMLYHPEIPFGKLPGDSALRQRMAALPEERVWEATELLRARAGAHFFYACRDDRDVPTYRIQFDDETFLQYVPVPRVTRFLPADPLQGRPMMIERPPAPSLPLDPWHAAVFAQMDGKRTVMECLRNVALSGGDPVEFGRAMLGYYWRQGYLLFRLPAAE